MWDGSLSAGGTQGGQIPQRSPAAFHDNNDRVDQMTKYRRRLFVIVSVTFIVSIVLDWLSFNSALLQKIAQNPITSIVLTCVGIASLCFQYYVAKRRPEFVIGIAVGSVGLILLIVCGIVPLAFNLDNVWLDGAMDFGLVLIFLASLIYIWQGVRKSRAEKNAR
jgi:peptidoglycan/LPS O-acetylase OafA/YrhL